MELPLRFFIGVGAGMADSGTLYESTALQGVLADAHADALLELE